MRHVVYCLLFNSINNNLYMDKKIRIGVMGCADIAQRLVIPAIQQLGEKFKLVGVASRTADKARSFADRFACESIEGYNTLVLRDDIDAVYIPLPTGLHKEWIIKALEHGKHVYAEKSIAMNGIDAEDMVTCAKLNRVALMEGYMFQYHKQHQVVKDLLKSNVIGEMRLIRASFGFPPFSDLANFRYDNKIGGGALKDVAGYVLRAVNFLNDNRFGVMSSNVCYNEYGTSLFGTALLKDGKLSAEISFGFDNFYQCNYEIWGSIGKISVLRAFTPKPEDKTIIVVETQGNREEIHCPAYNHFVGAMEEFYRICNDDNAREKHYVDILFQSRGLDDIERLSK